MSMWNYDVMCFGSAVRSVREVSTMYMYEYACLPLYYILY